jgi:transcriptional regulator with XRE-family HTH domain
MSELQREAREEGPAAERELEAWGRHFELAGEIARRRKALGWTQLELAKRVGLKQSEVSRLESGDVNPTWETVRAVLGALGARIAIMDRERMPKGRSKAAALKTVER